MNKLGALDDLDPNNVGGREQLINRMLNHQVAILEVKPVVQTRKPPRPHVDANKDKNHPPVKYKRIQEYGNVYATFRAVTAKQKPRIDGNEPETMKFKALWGQKKKGEKFQEREHRLNMEAQRARINNIGAMHERKKNQNDPLAHPTYLLTSAPQPRPNSALLNQILKPQKKMNPVVMNRLTSKTNGDKKEAEGGLRTQSFGRPSSAPFQQQKPPQPVVVKRTAMISTISEEEYARYKEQFGQLYKKSKSSTSQKASKDLYGNDEIDFGDEIPTIEKNDPQQFKKLKFDLIQLLIKYRIYKEQDLKVVFARTTLRNIGVAPIRELDQIYESIHKELDA